MKDSTSSEREPRTDSPETGGGSRVFDRPASDHRWNGALEELEADPTWKFVARNWRMDPRVARAREEALLESEEFDAEGPPSGEIWQKQLGDELAGTPSGRRRAR